MALKPVPPEELEAAKKRVPWWIRLLLSTSVCVLCYDDDFGEDMKFGLKWSIKF